MAITPNKAQIEAAGLEYVEPTEIVKDTGPKALNLLAQAVVDLMAKGSGSGVREVSGTVTLTTTDGPLAQVYATASATVQGEALSAGEIAIFRQLGGLWEVRVMNADGSVRDATWRPPGAPDTRTPVTAAAPTWTDNTASGGGTWSTPSIAGVTYSPASGTATPGQSVTVTATAQTGYRLDGVSSWTHGFPPDPNVVPSGSYSVEVLADSPRFYLPLDDAEGSTAAVDEVGGTSWPATAVTFGAAGIGDGTSSAAFDGSTSLLESPTSFSASEGSMSLLMTPDAVSAGNYGGDMFGTTISNFGLVIYDKEVIIMRSGIGGGTGFTSASGVLVAGMRYLFEFTWDASGWEAFLNGSSAATGTDTIAMTGKPAIGYVGKKKFGGRIAGVALYPKRQTAARALARAKAAGLA